MPVAVTLLPLLPLSVAAHARSFEALRGRITVAEVDDLALLRFLVAHSFVVSNAAKAIEEMMEWRRARVPVIGTLMNVKAEQVELLRLACSTGTIICPGRCADGRSLVVLDNSASASLKDKNFDSQVKLAAFCLDFALRHARPPADSLVLLCKLNQFSANNQPSLMETREMVMVLTRYFPTAIGQAVLYRPPLIFSLLFNAIRPLIPSSIAETVVMISGGVDDGSANDIRMRGVIGSDWKRLTGCEQPVLVRGCTPGFDPEKYWATILDQEARLAEGGELPPAETLGLVGVDLPTPTQAEVMRAAHPSATAPSILSSILNEAANLAAVVEPFPLIRNFRRCLPHASSDENRSELHPRARSNTMEPPATAALVSDETCVPHEQQLLQQKPPPPPPQQQQLTSYERMLWIAEAVATSVMVVLLAMFLYLLIRH